MAAAPNSKSETRLGVDLSSFEATAERIRELNERLIQSSKAAGATTLDGYEKALQGLVDLEQKVAGATQLEWVSALAQTHARVVRNVSEAYTKAAREMLS